MANYVIIIAIVLVASQVQTRDIQLRATKSNNLKKAAPIITYNELLYILETRNGSSGKKPNHLTPCARAILSCCENSVMNEQCSESLNCGSYFFDDNPCEDKFIIDALDAAKLFYDQFNESKV